MTYFSPAPCPRFLNRKILCNRNPFPEPLLLTVVLKASGENTIGEISEEEGEDALSIESSGITRSVGASEGGATGGAGAVARVPFALLLKKTVDLVLQPFQALQVRQDCSAPVHELVMIARVP